MNELLRCPHRHRWSDALLVWAAGDCCPSCNGEMGSASDERLPSLPNKGEQGRVRPPLGLSRTEPHHLGGRGRVSELR
jgi:hypothetical protein